MKLYYIDGTPEQYEPHAFTAAKEIESYPLPMEDIEIGSIDTNYHR